MAVRIREYTETVMVQRQEVTMTCDLCGKAVQWHDDEIPKVHEWLKTNEGLDYCPACATKRANAQMLLAKAAKVKRRGRPRKKGL